MYIPNHYKMFDRQTIKGQITKIKQLLTDYENLINNPNSKEAIDAYHKWYDQSIVLFSHYFNNNNKEYAHFIDTDDCINGYELENNYQKIRKDFFVLIKKLERGDIDDNIEFVTKKSQTQPTISQKRIFISHASKDKEIVGKFVDLIILLGMGLESKIIAYTSREETGVIPGESIPKFIQNNIACADIILLMLSDNYKNSEVCLNEMGAAWALNKHIIQILLPNTSFDKLGWLESLNKAIKIDCNDSMDSLCEVLSNKLNFKIKPSVWNRNKAEFIKYCTSQSTTHQQLIISPTSKEIEDNETEELGFIDYRERIENDAKIVTQICMTITNAIYKCNNNLEENIQCLHHIKSSYSNIYEFKEIMKSTAKGIDTLSAIIENNAYPLKKSFFSMIENATKMKALIVFENRRNTSEEYKFIYELIESISKAKSGMINFKVALDKLPKAEKTINKSRKCLSQNLNNIIEVLDNCIVKSQELLKSFL